MVHHAFGSPCKWSTMQLHHAWSIRFPKIPQDSPLGPLRGAVWRPWRLGTADWSDISTPIFDGNIVQKPENIAAAFTPFYQSLFARRECEQDAKKQCIAIDTPQKHSLGAELGGGGHLIESWRFIGKSEARIGHVCRNGEYGREEGDAHHGMKGDLNEITWTFYSFAAAE